MVQRKTILLLTNSEYGQANVILAVIHELVMHGGTDIHVGSFPALRPRVAQLSQLCDLPNSSNDTTTITFHEVSGLSMEGSFLKYNKEGDLPHPPGVGGAILSYKNLPEFVARWDGPEYIQSYQSCAKIVNDIDPAVIVVDSAFSQGLDVCRTSSRKYIVMSPNTLKDLAASIQPRLAIFWKYPAISSGFPFPLPWYLIPMNIYINIRLILTFIFASQIKMLNKYRHECGITGMLPLTKPYLEGEDYLCPSLPEIDFPCVIPSNITACGPILLAVAPVSETDPGLAAWLQRGPTILVNLGTHTVADEGFASELATGLRVILDLHTDVQVLWKLKSEKNLVDSLSQILAKEITASRVKIESWLQAEPLAVLQSGHVVCSVHHGGANSYYEATTAGVPQIILAQWYDTYDFAARVEWLGIGIYGNRTVAPRVDGAEFGQALVTVVGDGSKRAQRMRENARNLSEICQKSGGRALACDKIMEMAQCSE